jgi:hypothetical protein
MQQLSRQQMEQIEREHGTAEFARFRNKLHEHVRVFNQQAEADDKITFAEPAEGNGNGNGNGAGKVGSLQYHGCTFHFAYEPSACIVYHFQMASNRNMSDWGEVAQDIGDPRSTPPMRYTAEILGSGVEPGCFQFLWDGVTTDELAEDLLVEFLEWVDSSY